MSRILKLVSASNEFSEKTIFFIGGSGEALEATRTETNEDRYLKIQLNPYIELYIAVYHLWGRKCRLRRLWRWQGGGTDTRDAPEALCGAFGARQPTT